MCQLNSYNGKVRNICCINKNWRCHCDTHPQTFKYQYTHGVIFCGFVSSDIENSNKLSIKMHSGNINYKTDAYSTVDKKNPKTLKYIMSKITGTTYTPEH